MRFYENSLFWKLILPMAGLFAVFTAIVYGVASSHSAATGGSLAGQLVWMLVIFAVVIATQVWLGYSTALAVRIQNIADVIDRYNKGQGVLTKEFDTGNTDELSGLVKNLNQLLANLRHTVTRVADAAGGIIVASENLGKLTESAGQSMQKHQHQTDMVATAVTEMSNSVVVVAENAQAASDRSIDAVTSSNNGQRVITETVSAIDRVSAEMNNAKSVVQSLNKDSENIGAVLDVIKGIAEQTNLLALNAAIEAARAGEQDRGFAVVADEMRTLASKTQESTREIEAMIERLQAGAGQAVGVIEQGVASTASTVEQAEQARKAITEIVDAVKIAKQMSEHISHATREQKDVTEEMNRNILAIADASNASVRCTQDISASTMKLCSLAQELKSVAGSFRV